MTILKEFYLSKKKILKELLDSYVKDACLKSNWEILRMISRVAQTNQDPFFWLTACCQMASRSLKPFLKDKYQEVLFKLLQSYLHQISFQREI